MFELEPLRMLFRLLALVPAFVLHELGHALASTNLGDPTPAREGRLTLNPAKHLDPLGAFALLLMVTVGFFFAWAKPVQINPNYYDNYRRGMAIVALAGPAMNFLIMLMGAAAFGILHMQGLAAGNVELFFGILIFWNGILMLFNLLPIPPLDGGKVLAVLLPGKRMVSFLNFGRQYGLVILFGLIGLEFLAGIPVFSTPIMGGINGVTALLDWLLPTPLPQLQI